MLVHLVGDGVPVDDVVGNLELPVVVLDAAEVYHLGILQRRSHVHHVVPDLHHVLMPYCLCGTVAPPVFLLISIVSERGDSVEPREAGRDSPHDVRKEVPVDGAGEDALLPCRQVARSGGSVLAMPATRLVTRPVSSQ